MSTARPKRKIGVLISGGGGGLIALMRACENPAYPANIACVISSKPGGPGLAAAAGAGIPNYVIEKNTHPTREAMDQAIDQKLRAHNIEIICLAGYLWLLSPSFIQKWQNRVLNIHPSLLPAFPGIGAMEAAFRAKVPETGITVHLATSGMDNGPIILQEAMPILPEDTEQSLITRLVKRSHELYPVALRQFIETFPSPATSH